MLIVLSGLPATGKTALATAVAGEIGAALLSVDPIDSALTEAGVHEMGHPGIAAYAVVGAVAEQNLAIGLSVVVDAVNAVGEAKTFWIELARRTGAPLLAVEAIVSDDEVHRTRLDRRIRALAIAEPSWDAVRLRRDEWVAWPFAPLVVDAVDPLAGNVARVVAAARAVMEPLEPIGPGSGDNETPEGTSGP
ncbi:MAG TPA: AAA family ATPase [Candidatus Limnocylindrales bacterium]|nr:AAA family ATPase [Candidatus Limnocylindrales bacterium]